MDAMYEKLADAIEKSNKTYDIPRIKAAYELAKKAHEGQMRSSGCLLYTSPSPRDSH